MYGRSIIKIANLGIRRFLFSGCAHTSSCPLPTMPIPVEGPRPMATPKTSKIASGSAEEAPPSASPAPDAKIRKLRKRKGKEPEDVDPPADVSQPVEDKSWTWKPLTESSASRVAPVFTKDGRCVQVRLSADFVSF